jgi:uncharacterized protein (TIGR02996 family)
MTHTGGLLAGLLEHPEDEASWLVLADWLEEQGDAPRRARGCISLASPGSADWTGRPVRLGHSR